MLILLPPRERKRLIRLILANADISPLLSLELEESREKQNNENRRVHFPTSINATINLMEKNIQPMRILSVIGGGCWC